MKSIILSKYGAPEVLKVKELRDPEPLENQIRVEVHYAGINFAEIMARMKLYPGGPKPGEILGGEISGIVNKIGNDGWYLEEWKKDKEAFNAKKSKENNE